MRYIVLEYDLGGYMVIDTKTFTEVMIVGEKEEATQIANELNDKDTH